MRVKTSCGEYERPINRIAVIYPEEGYKQQHLYEKNFLIMEEGVLIIFDDKFVLNILCVILILWDIK